MVLPSFWCCGLLVAVVVLAAAPTVVTGKSRNRVQKWQQRTWQSRFGSGPRSEWKFDHGGTSGGAAAGLSRNELDLLADRGRVPNGYSNFHYRFDDLRRSHHRKPKHRVKRFAVDSDEEPVEFQDDLLQNAPFVFGDNYPQDQQQGLGNDLVDLDFVRDSEEDDLGGDSDVDFMPWPLPANRKRFVTVPEDDPFPHSKPKRPPSNNLVDNNQNSTQKVQYTLIIHHGGGQRPLAEELGDDSSGGAGQNLGVPLLLLVLAAAAASPRIGVLLLMV